MITRVAIPMLLLPLTLTLPLMFALAWLLETISDMAPPPRPSNDPWSAKSGAAAAAIAVPPFGRQDGRLFHK